MSDVVIIVESKPISNWSYRARGRCTRRPLGREARNFVRKGDNRHRWSDEDFSCFSYFRYCFARWLPLSRWTISPVCQHVRHGSV
jgi:hypothetical protein